MAKNAKFLAKLKTAESKLEKTKVKTPKEKRLERLISKVGKKKFVGKR